MDTDPAQFATSLFVILLGLSIHEFAHAKFADLAGDPTPRLFGRVTLNPLNHLDPIGTIMIIVSSLTGFGIGWGRPVPMDPGKMRNPRWDHFAAVAAGPLSNLIQAVLYAVAIRIMVLTGSSDGHLLARYALFLQDPGTYPPLPGIELFLLFGVLINLGLCFFNLIPLGPLDGHWLLGTFLAEPARLKWYLWNRQVGGFVFIAVFFLGQMNSDLNVFGRILWPATFTTYQFLVGR